MNDPGSPSATRWGTRSWRRSRTSSRRCLGQVAKVVRRSIHLTPFGDDFCNSCLIEEEAVALTFPAHAAPSDGDEPDVPGTS